MGVGEANDRRQLEVWEMRSAISPEVESKAIMDGDFHGAVVLSVEWANTPGVAASTAHAFYLAAKFCYRCEALVRPGRPKAVAFHSMAHGEIA